MRILICSDGTDPADNPTRLGDSSRDRATRKTTLLGIVEDPGDEEPLRRALESEAAMLNKLEVFPDIVVRSGEPIRQILAETTRERVRPRASLGRAAKGTADCIGDQKKTYEVIKAVPRRFWSRSAPVTASGAFWSALAGKNTSTTRVCSWRAKSRNASAAPLLFFTSWLEPPAIYADLVRLEEDVGRLLASDSELGRNLRGQRRAWKKWG